MIANNVAFIKGKCHGGVPLEMYMTELGKELQKKEKPTYKTSG